MELGCKHCPHLVPSRPPSLELECKHCPRLVLPLLELECKHFLQLVLPRPPSLGLGCKHCLQLVPSLELEYKRRRYFEQALVLVQQYRRFQCLLQQQLE